MQQKEPWDKLTGLGGSDLAAMTLVKPMLELASAAEAAEVGRAIVTTAAHKLPRSTGAFYLLADDVELAVEGVWDGGNFWLPTDPCAGSELLARIATKPLTDALRLPLRFQGIESGEIRVWNSSQHEENIARLLALLAGMALGGLTLKQRLNKRLVRDPLTGLYNLRSFEDILAREVHRAQRLRSSVCVILADLDDFAAFNRRFGNAYSDRVLQAVAHALQASFRGSDACCRVQGQRFAVMLPDADIPNAEQRANDLVELVGELRIDRQRSILPRISVSIGVVGFPAHAVDAATLLDGAEAALLLAKRDGPGSIRIAQREE